MVATAAQGLGMLSDEGFQVIVAVALLSITVNPALFALTPTLRHAQRSQPRIHDSVWKRATRTASQDASG